MNNYFNNKFIIMDNKSGIFICPKCGYNGMNGHKKWLSRNEYSNNQLMTKFIFYNELSNCKWVCCKGCCCCEKDISDDCGNILSCGCYGKCNTLRNPIIYCFYPCSIALYISICIWIDIINFLCCFKRVYNKVKGIKEADNIEVSRIWEEIQGFTKEYYNSQFLPKCDNCKYSTQNFYEFIPSSTKTIIINNTISDRNDLSERKILNINEIIAINLSNQAYNINFCTTCKKTDKFYEIEKKLYEEYPQLKKKKIYFCGNGQIIDKNKTIEENKINSGNHILINEC